MKQRLHRTLIIASLILLSARHAIAQQPQNRSPSEIGDFLRQVDEVFRRRRVERDPTSICAPWEKPTIDPWRRSVNELKVLRDLLDAAGSIAPDMRDEISKTIKRWEEKQARAKKDFQEFASSVNSASYTVRRPQPVLQPTSQQVLLPARRILCRHRQCPRRLSYLSPKTQG